MKKSMFVNARDCHFLGGPYDIIFLYLIWRKWEITFIIQFFFLIWCSVWLKSKWILAGTFDNWRTFFVAVIFKYPTIFYLLGQRKLFPDLFIFMVGEVTIPIKIKLIKIYSVETAEPRRIRYKIFVLIIGINLVDVINQTVNCSCLFFQ